MDAAVQGLGMTTLQSRQDAGRAPSPATPDEEALSKRALAGDRAAWDALIARHQRRVVVSLLARGLRVDRAQELAQETWARLIQQQQRGLLAELRLPHLALTQASFLASDEARRARRESVDGTVEDLPERQQPVDPTQSAEKRLLSEEQLARARDALEQVSPSARNVFLLACDGQGLPHAEVASRVGLSVQRVRQILCEVRKKLRTALEEENHV
ncbi:MULTISPECIES: RNA polymerase sigma factor [Corallococcus]|uniref:RNA polymerase sigma factor n=1 Tax=Corallococcus TaxID=83461 RepID=UPI00117E9CF7|nr:MULTISPECIES: sigma-70 family RNA polymerase sigma factor [Corallococcus]NBD07991.1 sigma-70 family RNA polymerase sigma factor [Corallococcus silvisoli]TSC33975.1 sigma-70 family RNA polymerase sigma factor [Corallococcus sp. Z5C101001]